jgi:glutamate dehydrogenase
MVANRLGCAGLARLVAEAEPAEAARAAILADRLLGLDEAASAADAAPAAAGPRRDAALAIRHLHTAVARELLTLPGSGNLEATLATLRPGIAELAAAATEASAATPAATALREAGLPEAVARLAAAAPTLEDAPAVVRLSTLAAVSPAQAGKAWQQAGEAFHLPALRLAAVHADAPGPFGTRAKAALLDDIASLHGKLAAAQLRGASLPDAEAAARTVQDAALRPDLAAVTVAVRELGRVVQ